MSVKSLDAKFLSLSVRSVVGIGNEFAWLLPAPYVVAAVVKWVIVQCCRKFKFTEVERSVSVIAFCPGQLHAGLQSAYGTFMYF